MTQPINGSQGPSPQELASRAAERDKVRPTQQAKDTP
jgi:hypothetical protein